MSNNRGTSDTPKCDVAACTRARPRSLQRVARLWRPPSRIGRKLPGRPRFSSQANVRLSCEPRKQAERTKDALRRAGVRQIQARVSLRLSSRGSLPRKASSSPEWEAGSHRASSTHEIEVTRERAANSRGMRTAEEAIKWDRSGLLGRRRSATMDRRRAVVGQAREWVYCPRAF